MKLCQFSMRTVAVVAGLAAIATAFGDEPRGYETYDEVGLIYFEDIKPVSKDVKAAWGLFRAGNYLAASRMFERLVLADRLNDQAILGWVESNKKLATTKALVDRAEKLFHVGTNKDNYALNMVKALSLWNLNAETRGGGDLERYLQHAQSANPSGLLPRIKSAVLPDAPKKQRKTWDRLHEEFPNSEGIEFYRCKVYYNGDLGGGYIDPITHKIVSTVDKENLPQPETALKILKPYLERSDVPKWAAYVACFVYKRLRQPEKIEAYVQMIRAAAATGNPVYVRWNNKLDKLLKPSS